MSVLKRRVLAKCMFMVGMALVLSSCSVNVYISPEHNGQYNRTTEQPEQYSEHSHDVLSFQPAYAHTLCALKAAKNKAPIASRFYKPSAKALKWLGHLTRRVGIAEDSFKLLAGTFNRKVGAYAVIRKDQRFIVYDKDFIFNEKDGVSWHSLSVLAHEIGHHVNGDTAINQRSSHSEELSADYLSGFLMYQFGASLKAALAWTHGLSKKGSESHPPRAQRQQAVEQGWNEAKRQASRS